MGEDKEEYTFAIFKLWLGVIPAQMNSQEENREIVLAERPSGALTLAAFGMRDIEMPQVAAGEVLLKSLYISVDPGMRGFMDAGKGDYAGVKFELDKPITSRSVAQVMESGNDDFPKGTIVHGRLAWQKYQAVKPDGLEKVDPDLAPIATSVSILGVTGLAAYFGMSKIGSPQKGETVVVSGAAGAVGSIAAQIAKMKGCRVVGIAGSEKKTEYLEQDLSLNKGINYKEVGDLKEAIRLACPNGVDVFFDNVGGELLDAVLANINRKARIVLCGQIAEYDRSNPPQGPRPQQTLIKKSARMEGFVVFDFKDDFGEAKRQLAEWYNSGQLKYRENLVDGFENLPSAFIGLFKGENIGKQMVKVADMDETS
ncbi:MAG: NADP-dependent oxidoreductase [Flavobacteriales bacterium]